MSPEFPKSELDLIAERISSCTTSQQIWDLFSKDFTDTFISLGLSDLQASDSLTIIKSRFSRVHDESSLLEQEQKIRDFIKGFNVLSVPFFEVVDEKLSDRADLIFSQIETPLREIIGESPVHWPVLDWGCGDGEVTRRLYENLGMPVSGSDVRDYRSEEALESNIPFFEVRNNQLYSDGQYLEPAESLFRIGLMTNVAHHEADNEKLLQSLSEYVSDYLVVIETIPDPRSTEDEQIERDRTFMNDYLYNRLFHDADVPVPGTYETREGWVQRFAKHGWSLQGDIVDLGVDQPTIQDYHVLYVFKKNHDFELELCATRNRITGEIIK